MPIKRILLYIFPFSVDIIVGLLLFLGRHSLASQGFSQGTVASIAFVYGIGYVIASLMMMRIVKPQLARMEMLISLAGMAGLGILLANTYQLRAIQLLYFIFPFMASLFFNSYQIFMLGVSNHEEQPLNVTAGHFTTSWAIGFAFGPFLSSQLVEQFEWNQVYYAASILAGIVALVLLFFNPAQSFSRGPRQAEGRLPQPSPAGEPDLAVPAWIALLLGQAVWSVVMVYWPIQAVQLNFPASSKGLPEFLAAIFLGLSALALTKVKGWYLKQTWITCLGFFGVAGLLIMSLSEGFARFPLGMSLYGIFSGSYFSLAVYHAIHINKLAVSRVAFNEVLVGTGFLLAFPLSEFFHPEGWDFSQSYLLLSILLAAGITLQAILIFSKTSSSSSFTRLWRSKAE